MAKDWGESVRMSIRQRRILRREPTIIEVDHACALFKVGGPLDDVTAEEIMTAYNKGDEVRSRPSYTTIRKLMTCPPLLVSISK